MHARGDRDARLVLRDRQRRARRGEPRPDRHDPLDSRRARSLDRALRIVERVEMRVRVDHAAAVGASTRGKSGAAG
jgi:hypothetical protein